MVALKPISVNACLQLLSITSIIKKQKLRSIKFLYFVARHFPMVNVGPARINKINTSSDFPSLTRITVRL